MAQLAGHGIPGSVPARDRPRLHFIDNLDPATYDALLAGLPLATTRFVAISKSGGTAETLMQTIAALTAVKQAGLHASAHFLVLTEAGRANSQTGCGRCLGPRRATLDHDPGVGGRYSVLTNVGLLPAAMLGLDIGHPRRRGR